MDAVEFGNYMKSLRLRSGYESQRKLAEATGISNGTIARIENGTQKPKLDTLAILAPVFGVQATELFYKSGLITEKEAMEVDELRYQYTGNQKLKDISEASKNYRDNNVEDVWSIKIPILGLITAGLPIFAEEHIEEWTEIPNMWNLKEGETFILNVKGDSMIGSRIFDGDQVIVKIQPEVETNEIAVVNVDGNDATLKRVKKINGQTILYPDNPKYEPIFIENENARIIGKVVQVMFDPNKKI